MTMIAPMQQTQKSVQAFPTPVQQTQKSLQALPTPVQHSPHRALSDFGTFTTTQYSSVVALSHDIVAATTPLSTSCGFQNTVGVLTSYLSLNHNYEYEQWCHEVITF